MRLRAAWLLLCGLVATGACAGSPSGSPARAWLLVRDEHVIGAAHADRAMPVGSLVKLLGALVWVQRPDRLAATVTISPRAAAASGARVGLRAGEQYSGGDLLTAMLVRSANDACIALAEQAAGSVDAFVADLNRAAALLELRDTHLVNPCGWDAPGQRSSARDILAIARTAMAMPAIRARVALPAAQLRTRDGSVTHDLLSTNLLLGRLAGADGVKTGFTAQAGKCLVAHVSRDGHEAWLVLLAAPERWWTAHRLLDGALAHAR